METYNGISGGTFAHKNLRDVRLISLDDLPLYVSWEWHSPEYMAFLRHPDEVLTIMVPST